MSKPNLKNEKFYLTLIQSGLLEVTKSGRAWNLRTGKELAAERDGAAGDYRKLSWQHPKTKKIIQVQLHRIVWAAFKGTPPSDSILNHADGNKQNCRLSNLELTDSVGNNQHAVDTGLVYFPKGEDKVNAKFTDTEVRQLRKQFAKGDLSRSALAKQKGTSIGVVSGMLKGRTYGHVVTKYDSKCKEL